MQNLVTDSMEQLLERLSSPAQIREIEAGGSVAALWAELNASGFLDALVSESAGGSGLDLETAFAIIFAAGRHALPMPLAQTLLVRAQSAGAGVATPQGPITIATAVQLQTDGAIQAAQVPFGRVSEWVLVDSDDASLLLPTAQAIATPAGGNGSLDANFYWPARPPGTLTLPIKNTPLALGALATAPLLAGALERVFTLSLAYANTRTQFGKPIGRQQAIQQQLSVMAEAVFAAKMAGQIGFDGTVLELAEQRIATAKAQTSAAVTSVASIGHAVHGAMGFTEEYDLQLYTRRLHEWRMAYGSEQYWYRQLGASVLRTQGTSALDFVREHIMAT